VRRFALTIYFPGVAFGRSRADSVVDIELAFVYVYGMTSTPRKSTTANRHGRSARSAEG
jgi:hypothetical protein